MVWEDKIKRIAIGDKVILSKDIEVMSGTMKAGTILTVTGYGQRGYDFKDNEGHNIIECGFVGFEKI